jgi:VanZ family protein
MSSRFILCSDAKKRKILRAVFAVCFVLWAVVIFMFSAENAENSEQTSKSYAGFAVSVYAKIFGEIPDEDYENVCSAITHFVRKTAHFTIYLVLSVFATLCALCFDGNCLRFGISYGSCVLYAISDEIHQYFVPGRAMMAVDVLIDSLGALLGLIAVLLTFSIVWKAKTKNS